MLPDAEAADILLGGRRIGGGWTGAAGSRAAMMEAIGEGAREEEVADMEIEGEERAAAAGGSGGLAGDLRLPLPGAQPSPAVMSNFFYPAALPVIGGAGEAFELASCYFFEARL